MERFEHASGRWDTFADYMFFTYGMIAYNGRLFVGALVYYDGNNSQVNSHWVSGLDLGNTANPRAFRSVISPKWERLMQHFPAAIPQRPAGSDLM